MTNTEYYQNQASRAAKRDFENNLSPDHKKYNALDGSAWAVHYQKCYNNLTKNTDQ